MQNAIEKNGWEHSLTEARFDHKWTYGTYFKNNETHMKALRQGRTTPSLVNHYKKIRRTLERKLRVSKFTGQGVSCKRKRRFVDDGDEVDIDRFLANSDTPWVVTKRNKKARNIKIAINFGLSCGNSEINFAKLISAGAYLSDVLTKVGYAVEVWGVNSTGYKGSLRLDEVCTAIKFKDSGQRLDIQRVLSMGLTGLFRNLIFGILEKKWKSNETLGYQIQMSKEVKKELGFNYVIEQEIVSDEEKMLDYFEKAISNAVEKRNDKTWEWV
jgi:hypothetical protein|tara:strand:- start:8943 stop:9752 length:810 start_codon:yes stop_codon:yes gene_type:complete